MIDKIHPYTLLYPHKLVIIQSYAKSCIDINGVFCEFGVYKGGVSLLLAHIADGKKMTHSFDSFQGLPVSDYGESTKYGDFKNSRSNFDDTVTKFNMTNDIVVHEGWFDDTLINFKEKIAFAHLDCDLFSSTKLVLNHITPLLTDKSVLIFDDYLTIGILQSKAVDEWKTKHSQKLIIPGDDIRYRSNTQAICIIDKQYIIND